MVKKAKSEQEALLEILSQNSMSAPFVFIPDDYRKGNATREPADLVWAWNNSILLMYMKQGKKGFDDYRDGNLRQALGWMRAWRTNPLSGRNAYSDFKIHFDATTAVAILSIVNAKNSFASIHDEKSSKVGVKLFATLPHSVVTRIFGIGGTTVDLLHFMGSLRGKGEVPENAAIDLLVSYQRNCADRSNPQDFPLDGPFLRETINAINRFLLLRPSLSARAVERSDPLGAAITELPVGDWMGMFCDLDLFEMYAMAKRIARLILEVRTASETSRIVRRFSAQTVLASVRSYGHKIKAANGGLLVISDCPPDGGRSSMTKTNLSDFEYIVMPIANNEIHICVMQLWDTDYESRAASLTLEWIEKCKSGLVKPGFFLAIDACLGIGAWTFPQRSEGSHIKLWLEEFARLNPST